MSFNWHHQITKCGLSSKFCSGFWRKQKYEKFSNFKISKKYIITMSTYTIQQWKHYKFLLHSKKFFPEMFNIMKICPHEHTSCSLKKYTRTGFSGRFRMQQKWSAFFGTLPFEISSTFIWRSVVLHSTVVED